MKPDYLIFLRNIENSQKIHNKNIIETAIFSHGDISSKYESLGFISLIKGESVEGLSGARWVQTILTIKGRWYLFHYSAYVGENF